MKQMHEISVQTDFSISMPTRIESPCLSRLSAWLNRRIAQLAANRRELLLTTAAAIGTTLIMLAASYLFFVQLAAYGW